jgi:hypothetical protein
MVSEHPDRQSDADGKERKQKMANDASRKFRAAQ